MPDPTAPPCRSPDELDDCAIVHGLLERLLANGDLTVPLLRKWRCGSSVRAQEFDQRPTTRDIIHADPALTMYVLRVAASAAKRPASPIVSLQHAVAWLGFDEVANIAFTLALQGRCWTSRPAAQGAAALAPFSGECALGAPIGAHAVSRDRNALLVRPAARHRQGGLLGAVHEIAQRSGRMLCGADYDLLIETFHRPIGARWSRMAAAPAGARRYLAVGGVRFGRRRPVESNVVNVAHRLADLTLDGSTQLARDLLLTDAAYRDLGVAGAQGGLLFDSAAAINAEWTGTGA